MRPDLATLMIPEAELEHLTGVEVGELFIGGVFGGVYRSSVFRSPERCLRFCLTEIVGALVLSVAAIPVALLLTRNAAGQDPAAISHVLALWLGTTGLAVLAWNLYMRRLAPRFRTLMPLLDAVDRHHAIVQAVHLLDQLGHSTALANRDRQAALDCLQITRTSLISGLQTERILREHRGFLARQPEVISLIETNLATLRTLEVNHQATEYSHVLQDALQIGLIVHREMHQHAP
jgi:hypothetical protein